MSPPVYLLAMFLGLDIYEENGDKGMSLEAWCKILYLDRFYVFASKSTRTSWKPVDLVFPCIAVCVYGKTSTPCESVSNDLSVCEIISHRLACFSMYGTVAMDRMMIDIKCKWRKNMTCYSGNTTQSCGRWTISREVHSGLFHKQNWAVHVPVFS